MSLRACAEKGALQMTLEQTTIVYAVLLAALVLLLVFAFLLPDRRAKKRKEAMQEGLKVGDRVFTKSGVHGTVTAINGDLVLLEAGRARTELEVARWSILSTDAAEARRKKSRVRTVPLNHDD